MRLAYLLRKCISESIQIATADPLSQGGYGLNSGVYIPLSGALIQEKRLEVLANNLANINTTGFKKDRPTFQAIFIRCPGLVA